MFPLSAPFTSHLSPFAWLAVNAIAGGAQARKVTGYPRSGVICCCACCTRQGIELLSSLRLVVPSQPAIDKGIFKVNALLTR